MQSSDEFGSCIAAMSEEITPQANAATLLEREDKKALYDEADLQVKAADGYDISEDVQHQER